MNGLMAASTEVAGSKAKWTARALTYQKVAKLSKACGEMEKGFKKLSQKRAPKRKKMQKRRLSARKTN